MLGFTSIFVALLAIGVHASPVSEPQYLRRDREKPQLPQSSLPPPAEGKDLRFLTLGYGTQNYTCANDSPETVPALLGAKANLFDVYSALERDADRIMTLSGDVLKDKSKLREFQIIGDHFFSANPSTPVFTFPRRRANIAVKKTGEAPSPDPNSVAWLLLEDNQLGATFGGIDTVYRVVTAGGRPPANCADSPPSFEVEYATLYWIYGEGRRGRRRMY